MSQFSNYVKSLYTKNYVQGIVRFCSPDFMSFCCIISLLDTESKEDARIARYFVYKYNLEDHTNGLIQKFHYWKRAARMRQKQLFLYKEQDRDDMLEESILKRKLMVPLKPKFDRCPEDIEDQRLLNCEADVIYDYLYRYYLYPKFLQSKEYTSYFN